MKDVTEIKNRIANIRAVILKDIMDGSFTDHSLQEKIKRSECPYGGIDCAWCMEDCE